VSSKRDDLSVPTSPFKLENLSITSAQCVEKELRVEKTGQECCYAVEC